jgi:IS30 family transposase
MRRTYSQIDLDERRKIERWRQAGVSVDAIAEKRGRHLSTIFREIARNKFEDREMPDLTGYFCDIASLFDIRSSRPQSSSGSNMVGRRRR